MAMIVVVAVMRTGFRFRPSWQWNHPAVRKLLALSGWTLGFVIANQVALVVVRNLAGPGSSDATAYFTAFTFFVLPHGLLAVSISTTFQPEMARAVARRDRLTSSARRRSGSASSRCSTGRFRHLRVAPTDHRGTARVPKLHGGGRRQHRERTRRLLVGTRRLLGVHVHATRVDAHHDTCTPFIINVVENAINIALAFLLVDRYGALGLGLAFALAYLISALWALQILSYKVPGFSLAELWSSAWRMVLAALLAAEAMWVVSRYVGDDSGAAAMLTLAVSGTAGLAVYTVVLVMLRLPEVSALQERVRRLSN